MAAGAQRHAYVLTEIEPADTEAAILDELAALRALIVGQPPQRRTQGVRALLGRLTGLFVEFRLWRRFRGAEGPQEGVVGWDAGLYVTEPRSVA